VPPGRNVAPAALEPASNAGVVAADRVCKAGLSAIICGMLADIACVLGLIPYDFPTDLPTAAMNLLASSILILLTDTLSCFEDFV